ncbi:MAG TPA: imidazole glycerol phosphate synthase subunit HisH [Legionellales bacterium]|nr:imidazole glycerol phosphate synthase subunit HisH [Legionellales bacterium]
MNKPLISIVDYGLGNIFSVSRAFEHFGCQVNLVSHPDEINNVNALVLPGVGAFANGIEGLQKRNLVSAIKDFAYQGKPLLGICLGMQLLFTRSFEFGEHQGLNLIPGDIIPIDAIDANGKALKVPHIGWNRLIKPSLETVWENTILQNTQANESVYFVHSFSAVPANDVNRLADCRYGDFNISAAVSHQNIYGCQFHPEKSGQVGLNIIKGFLTVVLEQQKQAVEAGIL